MPTKTVRDTNHNRLGSKSSKKKSPVKPPVDDIQVTHGNAPLLTVKFLDLIYKELKQINEKNG